MSFSRRVRGGLARAAAAAEPDVERSLTIVLARRRVRVRLRRFCFAAAMIGLAALTVFVVVPTVDGQGSDDRAPTVAAAQQLAGGYEVTLTAAETATVQPSLGGVWRMWLQPDGQIVLSAPPTFTAERNPLGVSFTADGAAFRTNIFYNDFCNSIGAYSWRLVGPQLSFVAGDDSCEIRKVLLTTKPWTRSS